MEAAPHITQRAIADACQITPASVSDWMTGKTKTIKEKNIRTTAKLLGVRQAWLSAGLGHMRGPEHDEPAAIYEQRLSARGLRILARLVEVEENGKANVHTYQIIEQALLLTDKSTEEFAPAANDGDVLAQLTPYQRDALAAFIDSLKGQG